MKQILEFGCVQVMGLTKHVILLYFVAATGVPEHFLLRTTSRLLLPLNTRFPLFSSTVMALRRFAQENNATASPRSPDIHATASPGTFTPSTPRTRLSYGIHRSPADTPSISSSVPFDWEAARSRAPPPYATPIRGRKSVGTGTLAPPRKAIVRKKSLFER